MICTAEAANLDGVWKLSRPQTQLTPADGKPVPFTQAGRLKYEEHRTAAAKGDYGFDLTMSRCASPGLPRVLLNPLRLRLYQRPTVVVMMFEWNRLLRQIALPESYAKRRRQLGEDAQSPVEEVVTAMGVARGRWEGDTLVVETAQFSGDTLLDNLVPTSEELRLTERLRLRDRNTLEHKITITDPQVFSRSWETVLTYQRQGDETFPEDVCLDRKKAGMSPWPR